MVIAPLPGGAVTPGTIPSPAAGSAAAGGTPSAGFEGALGRWLNAVDASNGEANQAVARMLDGSGDVADAMISLQQADLALQLTVQVRNKLVQAYQEIMRMPI